MTTETIARNLHQYVSDPHEFSTAYVAHQDSARRSDRPALPLRTAVKLWQTRGALT